MLNNLEQAIKKAQSELEKTCYHEAAHSALYSHFGILNHWRVSLEINEDVCSFGGYCVPYQPLKDVDNYRLVLLAGMVAEAFLEDEAVESWFIFDVVEGYRFFGCSSDLEKLEKIGGFTEEYIQDCLNIVKLHWPTIKKEANWRIDAMQDDVMTFANALLSNEGVNHV